jgi:hypothetical protein
MASVGHQIHYSKTYSWDITFVPRKENQSKISLKNQKGTLLLNWIKMKENAHNPFWFTAGMVIQSNKFAVRIGKRLLIINAPKTRFHVYEMTP